MEYWHIYVDKVVTTVRISVAPVCLIIAGRDKKHVGFDVYEIGCIVLFCFCNILQR